MKPIILVAAVALIDADNRVLIAQRPNGKSMAGLWEFPGGKIEPGETPEAALVRELKEELGHITGATNIPVTNLAHRLAELEPYRDREIVTVCKAGGRAHTAAQILMQAGFLKVHVMMGGMQGWKQAGFPTEA